MRPYAPTLRRQKSLFALLSNLSEGRVTQAEVEYLDTVWRHHVMSSFLNAMDVVWLFFVLEHLSGLWRQECIVVAFTECDAGTQSSEISCTWFAMIFGNSIIIIGYHMILLLNEINNYVENNNAFKKLPKFWPASWKKVFSIISKIQSVIWNRKWTSKN